MIFNSNIFLFAFFPVVFTLFWLLKTKEPRYVLLALAGYVFYGYWNWRFCGLLLFSSLVSFFTGIAITNSKTAQAARRWVILAVTVDLTLLGFFKYYNFFADSIRAVSSTFSLPVLQVVLPIGISFYTFHTISYVVDVAAGRVKATRKFFEYLTYVSLFSQLVAGPIVRFRQIEEDLENIDGPPREEWFAKGIGFFVIGLVRKVIIADHVAAYINPMLSSYSSLGFGAAWIAALGYTFQLYFDFSGYSDMAVGLGYLFGLRIPQNFNAPYRALGIGDFWRRWHISLSTWLRDYLYIPLGGSKKGSARTYCNLMVTMLLGGLWHGASWTFVFWGGYHGLLLALDRTFQPVLQKIPRICYRGITFLLVVIGWVFFRSTDFHMASSWLRQMFLPTSISWSVAPGAVAWVICSLLVVLFVPETWDIRFSTRRRWAVAYGIAFALTYPFINGSPSVFLYYQF
jgi:alginate O-acetyltransferase complex protein AlgI